MKDCERALLRRFPDQARVSFDQLLLEHLRARAAALEIDWQVVREADGAPAGSEDRANLFDLVAQVIPTIEAGLRASRETVLLVHPGLLARYAQLEMLERLRDQVGRKGACPGMWVLVASDGQSELPVIDGHAVPLISSGQRAQVPDPWIKKYALLKAVATR